MNIFGQPKRKRAHRKTKTWLDKQAAHSGELLEKVKNSPVIRAAIIERAIGVTFEPEELEMMDPQEFFGLRARLLKKLESYKTFPMTTNDNAFFNLFVPKGSHTFRKAHHGDFDERDSFPDIRPLGSETSDEAEQGHYEPRFAIRRPRYIRPTGPPPSRTRGTKEEIQEDQAAKDVNQFLNALAKMAKEATAAPQASSPSIYAVEVDGKWLEMTEEQYKIFSQKREEQQQLTEKTTKQKTSTTPGSPAPTSSAEATREKPVPGDQTNETSKPDPNGKSTDKSKKDQGRGTIILHGFLSIAPAVLIFITFSGGRSLASIFLVPKIADRYRIIPILSGVLSYIIRVWPGGRGHHDVSQVCSFELPKWTAAFSPARPDVNDSPPNLLPQSIEVNDRIPAS